MLNAENAEDAKSAEVGGDSLELRGLGVLGGEKKRDVDYLL